VNVRIQRRRTKGWRMPEGAVYVGRPSRWGNPYRTFSSLGNTSLYRRWAALQVRLRPGFLEPLRGFVWVEAAGRGKRGERRVWFLSDDFSDWHGCCDATDLTVMPLADWVAEFVAEAGG